MEEKIKIAVFTGSIVLNKNYHDVRNMYVMERLKYLKNCDDLEITIICPNDISDKIKNFHYITYPFLNKKHFRILSITVFAFLKILTLNCNKFHVFHCYSHEGARIAWLVQTIFKKRIRILFEPMGLISEEKRVYARYSNAARVLRLYRILEDKLISKKAYGVIVYTKSWKEFMSNSYGISKNNISIVPHGVNLKLFAEDVKKSQDLIEKLNLQNKKVIMYVGTLSPLHGPMILLKAIRIVNKKAKNIVCVIIGEGSLKSKVMEYIEKYRLENVILEGEVPQQEVPNYYALADILVIPHVSPQMDIPTKLIEYLASGKPIVSSNLKAIADVVGDNAILVEPDNPQAFAEGILTLLNDEELAKEMGENGKKIIYNYSWEESARKQYETYVSLYDSMKNEKKG